MARIEISSAFRGIFEIILYSLVFVCATAVVLLALVKQNESMEAYRCSPLFMPVSHIFGYDRTKNFEFCGQKNVAQSAAESASELDARLGDVQSSMTSVSRALSKSMDFGKSIITSATSLTEGITGRVNNLSASMAYLMHKMKAIFGKILAIYMSLIYACYALIKSMEAIVNDPVIKKLTRGLGKLTRFI